MIPTSLDPMVSAPWHCLQSLRLKATTPPMCGDIMYTKHDRTRIIQLVRTSCALGHGSRYQEYGPPTACTSMTVPDAGTTVAIGRMSSAAVKFGISCIMVGCWCVSMGLHTTTSAVHTSRKLRSNRNNAFQLLNGLLVMPDNTSDVICNVAGCSCTWSGVPPCALPWCMSTSKHKQRTWLPKDPVGAEAMVTGKVIKRPLYVCGILPIVSNVNTVTPECTARVTGSTPLFTTANLCQPFVNACACKSIYSNPAGAPGPWASTVILMIVVSTWCDLASPTHRYPPTCPKLVDMEIGIQGNKMTVVLSRRPRHVYVRSESSPNLCATKQCATSVPPPPMCP